jgi:hypothetical protein
VINLNIDESAEILINAMKTHSQNEVNNNAIQSIHRLGYIKAILTNNQYTVCIDEHDYTIEARQGLILSVNDVIIIMLFNGDINFPWIIDKKPNNWKR